MAGDLGLLPGRQLLVDFDKGFVGAARQAAHLFVDADGLIGRGHRLEFGDLAFKIGYRLFEIEIRLHPTRLLGSFYRTRGYGRCCCALKWPESDDAATSSQGWTP